MSEYKHRVAAKKMVASYLQSEAGVSTHNFRNVSTLMMEAADS
jgi:hypothetical protein